MRTNVFWKRYKTEGNAGYLSTTAPERVQRKGSVWNQPFSRKPYLAND